MDDMFLITDWQMGIKYDCNFLLTARINDNGWRYSRYYYHGLSLVCDTLNNIILN